MQITNKLINIQKSNPVSFNNSVEKKDNSPVITNTNFADARLSFMGETTSAALKSIAFAAKPEGYKKIGKIETPFLKGGHVYELNNGQKVIVIPKPGPTTINTYVKVGSMNEPDDIGGISHYIEHSLFNGSEKLKPNQFIEDLAKMGADYNANTWYGRTCYFVSTSSKDSQTLDKIVDMHADMIQHPTFTLDMIEKEKDIVISEIKRRKDNPGGKIFEKLVTNLFNIDSSLEAGMTLGSTKNIKNLTSATVYEYYDKWYTPNNMTTVIVGDVNPHQAIKLASKYFDKPAKHVENENKFYMELKPIQKTVREDLTSPQLNTANVVIAFSGPKNNDVKEAITSEALTMFLSGYKGTKLNKALKPLNTEPSVGILALSPKLNDPQIIYIETKFKPGDEEKGLEIIRQNLQDTAENPPSEKEMEIVKNKLADNLNRISESSSAISNFVGESQTINGTISGYTDSLGIINSLTPQDIQNAARKYLDMDKASIVVGHPETAPTEKSNVVSFTGRLKNNSIGNITEHNLSNNVHLVLNDNPDAIRSSAVITFAVDNLPDAKPGVVEILETMMAKGTKKHSEDELNDLLDINCLTMGSAEKGGNMSPFAGNGSIGVDINCLDKKLPLALDVAKEILLKPSFTEEKFNDAKEEIILKINSEPKSASDRAMETLFSDHPNKNTNRAILENIDQVTLADVKDFYNQIMAKPKVKSVVTTGQLSKDSGEFKDQIIKSLEKDIPKVKKSEFVDNETSAPLDCNKVVIEADDRNQAHIVQMFKIKETGDIKDIAALRILNTVLGGGMSSRLFMDLREKQGLAYEVGSGYRSNNKMGRFVLAIKTTTRDEDEDGQVVPKYENLQKSLDGFKKHINLLIDEKVSPDELNDAKKYLKDTFGAQTESSAQKTGVVYSGFNSKYGADYAKKYLNAVAETTPEDIQRVAKMYLTKPSVISVLASKDTLDNSKDYLKSFGELKEYLD